MSTVTMRDMLEAGVHFGHQTRYWNPKMAPYIFGERRRIHIINLEVTLPLYREAVNFLGRMAANNGTVLFVGTKRAAQEVIRREAVRCGMPYVDQRWLGGMLTNFKTVRASIARLREMESMEEDGRVQRMTKKEVLGYRRNRAKLERSLGGIKNTESLPDVLFVIDVGHEKIAIGEADKLGIPIVGVVDTNNEPDGVDYVIPGNDDSTRALELYTVGVADAIIEAREAARAGGADVGPPRPGPAAELAAGAVTEVPASSEDAPAAADSAADLAVEEPAPAEAVETDGAALSERIRRHLLDRWIEPARAAGEGEIRIRAGDISREMHLHDRVPAICAVLRSRRFLADAAAAHAEEPTPNDSTTSTFVYTLGPTRAGS